MGAMKAATYNKPHVEIYSMPSAAFGATSTAKNVIGPKGKVGRVVDILVDLTASAVGTTTVPEVNVGSAASVPGALLNEYARYRLGSAAGTGYAAAVKRATQEALSTKKGQFPQLKDFAGHVELEKAVIPADTAFVISGVAGVDGTPAGTGTIAVVVEWY